MITAERARELLHAYGGNASHWPQEYRAQLDAFFEQGTDNSVLDSIDAGSSLRQELERSLLDAQKLDSILDSYHPAIPDLSQQILEALPVSFSERLLTWLFPQRLGDCWRPALAAVFPLLLGIAIGFQELPLPGVSQHSATDWEAAEAALLTPPLAEAWYE